MYFLLEHVKHNIPEYLWKRLHVVTNHIWYIPYAQIGITISSFTCISQQTQFPKCYEISQHILLNQYATIFVIDLSLSARAAYIFSR